MNGCQNSPQMLQAEHLERCDTLLRHRSPTPGVVLEQRHVQSTLRELHTPSSPQQLRVFTSH